MIVNGLIKSLTIQKHNDFVKMINIINVKHLISLDLRGHENSSFKLKDLE
jgi:hypothetical protein